MNNKHSCLLFFLLFSFTYVSAQYTETLNSNRPGNSQGAFSVGRNVLQFETGLGIGKEEHSILNTETNVFTFDYSVRYGFFKEELEISLIGIYQSNTITSTLGNVSNEIKQSNFKSNTIGAKYLFYDPYRKRELEGPNLYSWKANNRFQWEDLIPAISIFGGANIDFADNPFTPETESSISPKLVLATQNNWLGGWVFVTNIIVDRITTDYPSYGYILTLTHTPTDWFSVFIENQGIKSDFYADQLLSAGTAILLSEDLHVDASVLINFKDTPSRLFGRIGIAYRFDMHDKDEYIEEKGKAGKANRDEKKGKKKNKNKRKKRKDGF
ncbi:MAG: transporter [Bacteroidetes bacterium]|nr:transporter [Bacteroidota bacterium]